MKRLMICWLGLALAAPTDGAATKPNVLLIFLDNVGYGDLGCYGNRENRTPNLDRLAGEGVRCTSFYIASPSCSPSRGGLLTGRHPVRNGLNYQLATGEDGGREGLPLTEKILPQYLKPLGYAAGAFGKWNIGFSPGRRPTERGFDEFLGHMSGNIHYYKHLYHGQNDLRRGIEPLDLRGQYSTDLFAGAAIEFMRRHRERPWFIYLPFNAVHYIGAHNVEPGEKVEWQVPAKYLALYGCKQDEADPQKRFRATLTALDDAVGRVLRALDDLQLSERTLVWVISDNGAFMLPGRGLEVQSNKPLREGGVTACEGGVRVPAIVRWPGRLKPGTVCSEMLSSLDILPMLVAAAGAQPPPGLVLDGRQPLPALAGRAASPHPALYWVWNQGSKQQWKGMRAGHWKILRRADHEPWELYDLSSDPGETHNLAGMNPAQVHRMVSDFNSWHAAVLSDPGRSISARE